MQNFGIQLEQERRNKDWLFGGISGIDLIVHQTNRNWDSFIPVYEPQSNQFGDTCWCVTFSALNCLETLAKRKYDVELNLSDRFTAIMSGTVRGLGNFLFLVAESLRKEGAVDEVDCPYLSTMTLDDAYAPISKDTKKVGKKFLEEYEIKYEFIPENADALWDALQYSPIQIVFAAYGPEKEGILQRTEAKGNHAVMLYGGEYGKYFKIYDHYSRCFKTLSWDSKIWSALRYDLIKKDTNVIKPMFTFEENHRYFVADGKGKTLFMFAGKLREDDLAKCIDQWIGRTNGDLTNKSHTITQNELDGVEIFNLKGEKV